ncbi:HlyD family type I secretion periplasmic adaptor subunit [Nitratireductor aquimarinus]|uniref:HlyD family type I secretion periplasmic adaptor subunit n=1 Tax=Alphaproteobacteria TaxID=28211 RepID=UPI0019D3D0C6|nr:MULTISPECIES: HlyD family type I secretion periplasmic adaptor subunit [Alphaproteobacteria]MBN7756649.1 HlyD family type I secretion periplasmic adaptor subunit [Nitratireductor aquimarinus]MBY5999734.1 HlyD family type I secretion periplasmic adaptor subunit [Tritonibacter mobilis]MBY6021760.1 HlyD family type I secretion periplasmic adaptor subunit [Nitratireductor sp. DP7N14-4]
MANRTEPAGTPQRDREKTFRVGPRVIMGVTLGFLLVGGVGGWAATAQLTGAVIAQGSVVVDQNLKSIQHRDGGIVSDIAVREGDQVAKGQVLIRLEDAQTKAERSIVRSQLVELKVRKARLLAERDLLAEIEFPTMADLLEAETTSAMNGETRLFDGNRAHRESQKQQLELGIEQIGDEINGLEAQRRSKDDEIALLDIEHRKIKGLVEKQLIEGNRLYASDREKARLMGERGEIGAAIARAKTRIGEVRLQIISIDETARTEAQRELSLVETKLSELNDRRIAIEDRLARTDIRAPISGTVNELNVHTIGGVITPAEVLVTIVPDNARLKVEVKIAPVSIDQVVTGQPARLRFSAFNQRTTPELIGEVIHVSPATNRDAATGEVHYLGDIHVPTAELEKLGAEKLLPGMPVEVYVTTENRTAISYLVKPLTDQFQRAFRER